MLRAWKMGARRRRHGGWASLGRCACLRVHVRDVDAEREHRCGDRGAGRSHCADRVIIRVNKREPIEHGLRQACPVYFDSRGGLRGLAKVARRELDVSRAEVLLETVQPRRSWDAQHDPLPSVRVCMFVCSADESSGRTAPALARSSEKFTGSSVRSFARRLRRRVPCEHRRSGAG